MKKLMMPLLLVPFVASAEITWKYVEEPDGIRIVGGYGVAPESLVIPGEIDGKKVVAIGECSPRGTESYYVIHGNLDNLKSLTLNEGLKRIGRSAFERCTMQSLKIPSTLKEISSFAFASCRRLVSVEIPEGVCRLKECAFGGCSSLEEIELLSTIINAERAVFEKCWNLKRVIFNGPRPSLDSPVVYAEEGKDNLFWQVPPEQTVIYVRDVNGWKDARNNLLERWCGRAVRDARDLSKKSCDNCETAAVCKVTFNMNGAEEAAPAQRSVVAGSEIGPLPTPARSGYVFLGWYSDPAGGNRVSGSTTISGATTLYARWQPMGKMRRPCFRPTAAAMPSGAIMTPAIRCKLRRCDSVSTQGGDSTAQAGDSAPSANCRSNVVK